MNVRRQVWEILYYFYIHLLIFNFNGLIKFKLPPIFINQIEEDKSALFEWIFDDFRIGFSMEANEAESLCYIATKDRTHDEFSQNTFKLETNLSFWVRYIIDAVINIHD